MNKLILITGVSQGLGRVMLEHFIKLGHTVIGCSRSTQEIANLHQRFGTKHDFMALDIKNETAIVGWAQHIQAKYHQSVDLLINNASIIHELAPLWTISSEIFDTVIDINIKGTANIIRHFVPPMIQQKRGIIVNFSAGWGRYTVANAAPYCASKWAIEGLTKALSQELPSGMAAVSLWPGTIYTETLTTIYGKEKAMQYPTPEQWAEFAIPFLLHIGPSDNGKPLTIPNG
ncbi:oxidoreductase [Achromatium sp. WMS3]|nr:oxidoreductase [Achromatium sp. WMS3]